MVTFIYPGFVPARLSTRDEVSFFVGGLVQIRKETQKAVEFEVIDRGTKYNLALFKVDSFLCLTCDGKRVVDRESIDTVIFWLHQNYC